MSLREDLAARLWTITKKIHKDTMGGICDGFEYYDGWDTLHSQLADECLRQMEWARHEWHNSMGCACYCSNKLDRTLAPPDWKP